MRNPLDLLRMSWGRFAAGFSLMLSVAWLNGGRFTGVIDWDATMAFAAAGVAWLYTCIPEPRKPSTHDKQLFDRFQNVFDADAIEFLRGQDFGGSFLWEYLHRIVEMVVTWKGPYFQFDDPLLQREFALVLAALEIFIKEVGGKHDVDSGVAQLREKFKIDDPTRLQATNAINDTAETIVSKLDMFIPLARKRLAK